MIGGDGYGKKLLSVDVLLGMIVMDIAVFVAYVFRGKDGVPAVGSLGVAF